MWGGSIHSSGSSSSSSIGSSNSGRRCRCSSRSSLIVNSNSGSSGLLELQVIVVVDRKNRWLLRRLEVSARAQQKRISQSHRC